MGRLNRGANKNVTSMFGGAQTAQLQTQITQRDEEIAALKEQLEDLQSFSLSTESTGVERYPTEQFIPLQLPNGLSQPRKYFDPKGMAKLKRSISKVGVQEPLLVRPGKEGKLEIISGERRWRCGAELQLPEMPAISRQLSDEEALEIALVANLMREDLNPVEETDSIVALIALRLKLDRQQLPSILFKIKNLRTRKQFSNEEIAFELEDCDENSGILTADSISDLDTILSEFSITLESFVANRLIAIMKMPEELLNAVRQGSLDFSKADVIRKADLSPELQQELVQDAINKGLTKKALTDCIKEIKADSEENSPDITQVFLRLRSKKNLKRIENSSVLKKKFQRLTTLAEELVQALEAE
jgi:ParB family chromosome partitioning protein